MPGTTESFLLRILEMESDKRAGADVRLCYNPEFMREGSAVTDFLEPPYTILGSRDPEHLMPLHELYKNTPGTTFETTIPVAEMVKYLSNTFHAMKVVFANEMGTLGEHLGLDTNKITEIFTSDRRLNISATYLNPGFAFGGSCLPKDIRALLYRARQRTRFEIAFTRIAAAKQRRASPSSVRSSRAHGQTKGRAIRAKF